MRDNARVFRSFASRVLAIALWGLVAAAMWFGSLALTVLGAISVLSGEPRGWWIPLGLALFGASFYPSYHLLRSAHWTRPAHP